MRKLSGQILIEDYNGLPNCFGHRLCIGSGFDGLHVSFIGVHQDSQQAAASQIARIALDEDTVTLVCAEERRNWLAEVQTSTGLPIDSCPSKNG